MSARLTAGVASALWAGAAALALHERRRAVRPDHEPPLRGGPRVSVIVPARDEERGIGDAVRSLRALEWDDLEVIVVNDQSRDGTPAAARAAAGDDPRVTRARGRAAAGRLGRQAAGPAGRGCRRRTGDWLLFTDADVVHAPDSLAPHDGHGPAAWTAAG